MEVAQKIIESQQRTITMLASGARQVPVQSTTSIGNTWGQMQRFRNQPVNSPSVIDIELEMDDVLGSMTASKLQHNRTANSAATEDLELDFPLPGTQEGGG